MASLNPPRDLEPPRYAHDSQYSHYLGHYENADLYVSGPPGSLIARYSSDPPDYLSSPIESMYISEILNIAFDRAVQRGIVREGPRDRVYCTLFAQFGNDQAARNRYAFEAPRALNRAFDPDHWDTAESLLTNGGADILTNLTSGNDLLYAPALRRAVRHGITDPAQLRDLLRDTNAYLSTTEAAPFEHDRDCQMGAGSTVSHVDDCLSCDRVQHERWRAESDALWEQYSTLDETDVAGMRKIYLKINRSSYFPSITD